MNIVDPASLAPLVITLGGVYAAVRSARRWWLRAQPDEWLLCVRDGRLVAAGVGISLLRRPGDVVVRFSSTMQRVAFDCEALSVERVVVRVRGFIFWSVAPEGDAPFRAYSRLGIADLRRPPPGLRHPRHLLTSPQHKAFQQILTAVVQRHASTLTLAAIVDQQDAFVDGLTHRLRAVTEEMGVAIDQVEVLGAHPVDETVRAQMGAAAAEQLREEAERVRREAAARIAADESRSALTLASERARLLDAEREVRAQEIAAERETALARLASKHDLSAREQSLKAELAQSAARARQEIAREEADAENARLVARAVAERDAELTRAEAAERKSAALREHERFAMLAEKVGAAVRVTDARWVGGGSGPAASVGAMLAEVRDVLDASARARALPPSA